MSPAIMEKRDPVRNLENRRHIMADHHGGQVKILLRAADQFVNRAGARRIETGGRLVEHENLRAPHQRSRERGPLLHPAAHLRWKLRFHALEPDCLERLVHALCNLVAGQPGLLDQREGDVVEYRHRVEQRARLKQHAEFLAHGVQAGSAEPRNLDLVDRYRARVWPQQQVKMLQQDGLARSARAHDGRYLARWKVEGDAVEHLLTAEAAAKIPHFDCVPCAGRVTNRRWITVAAVDLRFAHSWSKMGCYYKSIDVRK